MANALEPPGRRKPISICGLHSSAALFPSSDAPSVVSGDTCLRAARTGRSVGPSPIPTFRNPQSAIPTPVRVFRGCPSAPSEPWPLLIRGPRSVRAAHPTSPFPSPSVGPDDIRGVLSVPCRFRVFRGCISAPKGTGVSLSLPLRHLFAPNVFAITPLWQGDGREPEDSHSVIPGRGRHAPTAVSPGDLGAAEPPGFTTCETTRC